MYVGRQPVLQSHRDVKVERSSASEHKLEEKNSFWLLVVVEPCVKSRPEVLGNGKPEIERGNSRVRKYLG